MVVITLKFLCLVLMFIWKAFGFNRFMFKALLYILNLDSMPPKPGENLDASLHSTNAYI